MVCSLPGRPRSLARYVGDNVWKNRVIDRSSSGKSRARGRRRMMNVLHLDDPDCGAEVRDLPQEQAQRLGDGLAEISQRCENIVQQDQHRLHDGVEEDGQQRLHQVVRYQLEDADRQRPDHAVEHEAQELQDEGRDEGGADVNRAEDLRPETNRRLVSFLGASIGR